LNFDAVFYPTLEEQQRTQNGRNEHMASTEITSISNQIFNGMEETTIEEIKLTEEILEELNSDDSSSVTDHSLDNQSLQETEDQAGIIFQNMFDEVKKNGYMFPTYGSLGWTADVHQDEILLQMIWVGPDGRVEPLTTLSTNKSTIASFLISTIVIKLELFLADKFITRLVYEEILAKFPLNTDQCSERYRHCSRTFSHQITCHASRGGAILRKI